MNPSVYICLCSLLLLLSACGTLEVSVDHTATPDLAATGTVSALQVQNAQLATQIAMLNRATRVPTPTPLIVPAATRITFLNGATVGVVSASIQAGQSRDYVLQAFQGQPMFVYVSSPNSDVTLSITGQDGSIILSEAAHQISWQGTLLKTEDYYLTIHGGASTGNFSLTVTIPSRLRFAEGADSASVSGTTVAGYDVSYALFAAKGQNMSVDLKDLSGKASLSIYGFTDGQRYLHSDTGETSYHFALPSTQDYIIVVVPAAGDVVSYTLAVKIQ